jgi:hypothetical protein
MNRKVTTVLQEFDIHFANIEAARKAAPDMRLRLIEERDDIDRKIALIDSLIAPSTPTIPKKRGRRPGSKNKAKE